MASPSNLDTDERYYSSPMKLFVVALLSSLKNVDNSTSKLVFRPLMHQPRIYAGAPAGVHVTTVHAYDPDQPRKRIEYNLPDVLDYRQFVVDKMSGNLSTALVVEKSVGEAYQVMVAAVGSGSSELEHIQIVVTEFNQFAPRFQQRNYTLELHPGTAEPDSALLTIQATDPDPDPGNAEIYYKLDQNSSSRFFSLNSFTGELSLNQPLNESEPLQNFGVFAEDGGSPKRWDYVPVIVVMKTVSAPQNVYVTNVTHDSVLICWDAPLHGNVSGYILRYFPLDIDEKFQMNVTLTSDNEASVCERVENLTEETEYFFQVYGWNSEEDGLKSDAFSFNTTGNWCTSKITCQAAGHCSPLPLPPFFTCICPAGFFGPTCEFFDPCSLRPCANDGACVNVTHNEFVCVCGEDFHGPDCGSYDPCLRGPCGNGATCRATPEKTFVCACAEGFVGSRCERRDACLDDPCGNGGTCVRRDNGTEFDCRCPDGFAGDFCEMDLDECASSPCLHGATCINQVGRYSCTCLSGFSGHNCEIVAQCAVDNSDTDQGLFYWNATNHGEEGVSPCPFGSLDSNSESSARRPCVLRVASAVWGAVNASACKGKEFVVADELADELHVLTKDPNTLNAETLESAAQGLQTIAEFATQDKKLAEGMAKVISNLMEVNDTVVQQDQNDTFTEFSESVLQIVDDFVSNVEIKPGESLQLNSENVRIHAMDWHPDVDNATEDHDLKFTVPNRYDFEEEEEEEDTTPEVEVNKLNPTPQTNNISTTMQPQEIPPKVPMVKVYLPKEALQEAHRQLEGSVRVKFVVYYNDKLFQSKNVEQENTRAPDTSNEVDSSTGDVKPKAEKKDPEFKAPVLQISVGNISLQNMFKPLVYVIPLNTRRNVLCVYWNAKERQWSSDGLTTNHTRNYVICESTHMTAFSVLLDMTPRSPSDKKHEPILSVISYVGSALSIVGLTLTIITYLLFGCLSRDQTGRILSNLCVSLLLLNIAFLLGVLLEPPLGGALCAGVALSLHLLVLASLAWMCVEAVNMHQLLVHVFASPETHFMLKRCCVAWGGPLLIVAVTYSTNSHAYYEGLQYCMLSPHDPWIYYCSFLAPCCIILAINFIVFVLVSRVIFTPRLTAKTSFDPQPVITAAQVRGAFTVMVLLGVTWVFGTFALGDLKVAFQYLFCVANSLQGFLIFLVRCLLYPEARAAWARFFRTGRLKGQKGVVLPGGTASFSNSGGKNGVHQPATRNTSSEEGAVALDGSLFGGRKIRNSKSENAKCDIWIPCSQASENNSSNEQGVTQLKGSEEQFVISNKYKNTFPKMQKRRSTGKRQMISNDFYQAKPKQKDEIYTITNSSPFPTFIIPNQYNKEAELKDSEPSKFVPATITKRNLHLPYSEKQDAEDLMNRRSASFDFVSDEHQRSSEALSTTTMENLKIFLVNVKLRSNESAILNERSFCVDPEDAPSKPRKGISSSRKARVNRRVASKRKKSIVFGKEDEQTDDEGSTSTDVDDATDQPQSRRGSCRKYKSSRNGGGSRHPKNTCYHCRFGNSCDESSLPYTPPTSLRRT